ncbi:MAG TPA: hypothetical protein PLN86_16695 [Candidatus Hydrogenedentes bacterium]|nr:hypothetical protein [Candidatus Hydrogenedentota bacterium]
MRNGNTKKQPINEPEPRWTEKIYTDDSGEDFLGLRSVQGNITDYLLPGIITITPRARYYSFYSWLLHEYQKHHPAGMSLAKFIKRREQIFALANLLFDEESGYGERTSGMIGTRKLTQSLRAVDDKNRIPLNVDDYIGATYGGYSQFAGVMRSLEIIQESEDEKSDLYLLPKSKLLAASFEKAISETAYYKDRLNFDTANSIHRKILLEYGAKCYLSGLSKAPDRKPVLDVLFGFDAKDVLPDPQSILPRFGNMALSLGLMLDMLGQTKRVFNDIEFRRCSLYGACRDFPEYHPRSKLKTVFEHWRMFEIREYYVYALYEIWRYFLDILRREGPLSFEQFIDKLDRVDTARITSLLKIKKGSALSQIHLNSFIQTVLKQSDCMGGDFNASCVAYAGKYKTALTEDDLEEIILGEDTSQEESMLVSFLLLISIYLRLKGISETDQVGAWHWAKEGGTRRRSMALFVQRVDEYVRNERSLLDLMEWIFRDYIIAQHTIAALEKWRQRKVNTFHFSNNSGLYEWVRMDGNGFTASRFFQAYSMLIDLGLVEFDKADVPTLSRLGKETLSRVMEMLHG